MLHSSAFKVNSGEPLDTSGEFRSWLYWHTVYSGERPGEKGKQKRIKKIVVSRARHPAFNSAGTCSKNRTTNDLCEPEQIFSYALFKLKMINIGYGNRNVELHLIFQSHLFGLRQSLTGFFRRHWILIQSPSQIFKLVIVLFVAIKHKCYRSSFFVSLSFCVWNIRNEQWNSQFFRDHSRAQKFSNFWNSFPLFAIYRWVYWHAVVDHLIVSLTFKLLSTLFIKNQTYSSFSSSC